MWNVVKSLECWGLASLFEIGAEERESSLVIIPNYKPSKGSLLPWPQLTIEH